MDQLKATEICIAYIRKDIEHNEKNGILASLKPIQQRMIERKEELGRFFLETLQQIPEYKLQLAMEIIPDSYFFWADGNTKKIREDYDAIIDLNETICRMAGQLSSILEERQELLEHSRFRVNCHYDILDIINDAGKNNYSFQNWVKNDLIKLSTFDSKYWPSTSDFLSSLSEINRDLDVEGADASIDAVVSQHRSSRQDTVILLLADIQKRKRSARYPQTFRYSDGVIATIINIALNLPPQELLTAEYIKGVRQNLRKKGFEIASNENLSKQTCEWEY
ncbi:hypothetical protein [Vibrio cortegadensis]|uniref:Uncharacterized protein n=1 Tax=Vibrio cortegadensis TaxID=1328770 RepID=A0ABV4MBH2_9VIBR